LSILLFYNGITFCHESISERQKLTPRLTCFKSPVIEALLFRHLFPQFSQYSSKSKLRIFKIKKWLERQICLGTTNQNGKNIPQSMYIKLPYLKYTNWSKSRPNGHKVYQHHPLQDPPKFTQIGIFGLKMYVPAGNPGPGGKNADISK
jgi:hypothetical protein